VRRIDFHNAWLLEHLKRKLPAASSGVLKTLSKTLEKKETLTADKVRQVQKGGD
jgi:hypothetical protein